MDLLPIETQDEELIQTARDTLRKSYRAGRHGVAAAVRCASGQIYTGVNLEACGYGPCAEHIALGAAFTNGERDIVTMVAVRRRGDDYPVLSPCGGCRQLLVDYSPDAQVILLVEGDVVKARALDLLPGACITDFDG